MVHRTKGFDYRTYSWLVLVLCLLISIPHAVHSQKSNNQASYHHATISASINPVTASYLDRVIAQAEEQQARALILQLDTPGGLMNSMNRMTSRILNANLPVIVWIGPTGARAVSAGVFITYASHLASMAESTRIGAAHPVQGQGGEMNETMEEKVVNDAVAQLTTYADKRGRNQNLADSFVRSSLSLTVDEAINQNAVDLKATNIPDLLKKMDGHIVQLQNGDTVNLQSNTPVKEVPFNWKENFLNNLVNPNLVYILMMIGMYGLIYEFSNPGLGLGAAVGGVSLLLSLYGLSILPLNFAGLGLIGLGVALMVLDIFVPSFGVLTMGGMSSFFLGSVMLFETEAFSVSLGLIVGVTLTTALFLMIVGYLILTLFYKDSPIGSESMIGRRGSVKEQLNPEGMVHVHGEYWSAICEDDATIEEGQQVEVTDFKNDQCLIVKPPDSDRN